MSTTPTPDEPPVSIHATPFTPPACFADLGESEKERWREVVLNKFFSAHAGWLTVRDAASVTSLNLNELVAFRAGISGLRLYLRHREDYLHWDMPPGIAGTAAADGRPVDEFVVAAVHHTLDWLRQGHQLWQMRHHGAGI